MKIVSPIAKVAGGRLPLLHIVGYCLTSHVYRRGGNLPPVKNGHFAIAYEARRIK